MFHIKNAKRRMLFLSAIWIVFLVMAIFIPEDFRLIWMIIVSVTCLLFLLLNFLTFKGFRLNPHSGIAKEQMDWMKPCNPDLENEFNYQLLIDLAALLSRNDTHVIKEVTEAAFDYENYTKALLLYGSATSSIPEVHLRERWYPNIQVDFSLFLDYLGNRPKFCCMNMLNWLIDKGHIVFVHKETGYEEFVNLLRGATEKHGILIHIEELPLKKDDEARLYLFDNLEIAGNALQAYNYYLLNLDIGGDFNLAIVNEREYHQIRKLDWNSVKGELKIEIIGTNGNMR